jgi:LacI family transcriptional regulator
MPALTRIGILPTGNAMNPASIMPVMEGLLEFGQARGHWHVYHLRSLNELRGRQLHGVLIPLSDPSREDMTPLLGSLPRVFLINRNQGDPGPSVLFDDLAIGRVAAEHLLSRGLGHFGYCDLHHLVSRLRQRGFCRRLRRDGYTPSVASSFALSYPPGEQSHQDVQLLRRWLEELPTPAGVLAFSDHTALSIIETALSMGLRVPEDLAVVGVNNERLRCEFAQVPISSVDRDGRHLGRQAAALLERMIDGRDVPDQVLVPPAAVVTRASSDVLAIDDADVVRALRIIRAEACDELTVEAILDRVPISRSSLERRFRKAIGRSPHEEIRRVRLERARRLLLETTLNLAQIAVRSGFSSPSYLSKAFSDAFGRPPSQYRKTHQRPRTT